MPRDFDVILYGATGFTGRQTVAYLTAHAPANIRWAIAGRNRAKLEALDAKVPIFTSIDEIAQSTRVLLTTAGPFALYGTDVVDACVRHQTHYVDITGETPWVRMLIDRYHEKAAAEGTRIIPFCGFDSIPSDLGAMLISNALGPETTEVKAFFELKGGFNGGTLATIVNMHESGQEKAMADLFLLSPSITRAPRDIEKDPTATFHDPDLNTWAAPFMMGAINTRVVRRSCALRGDDFAYQEYMQVHSKFTASMVAGVGAFFNRAMRSSAVRHILQSIVPPGQGPSKKTMDSGWFQCSLFGKTSDGRTARGVIADQGDPGNRVTVKCVCESALALALDELPARAGVLTPSIGIGEKLVARLRAKSMRIMVE